LSTHRDDQTISGTAPMGIVCRSSLIFAVSWDLHDPKYHFRRLRGGSWVCDAADCAVSNRQIDGGPASTDNNIGFRLARNSN
jgi:formylglycine-generating enzyme required for sulfatase activity